MEEVKPEVSYIDGVVAYHQYRDFIGLTQKEARQDPDTLEVFDDITETVATADELRTAYTGVLRFRGAKRQAAMDIVRKIEDDITSELYDLGLITDKKYTDRRDAMQTEKGVKDAAQTFVKLFKKVIPAEELPKTTGRKAKASPSRTPSTTAPKAKLHKTEVATQQADRFIVDFYDSGELDINGSALELPAEQAAIFDELLVRWMQDPELYVRIDALRNSRRWQNLVHSMEAEGRNIGFGYALADLRCSLEQQGLSKMLVSESMGAGRMHKLQIDWMRRPSKRADSAAPTQHTAPTPAVVETTPATEKPEEPKDELARAIVFAGQLMSHVVRIIPDTENGSRISDIRKSITRNLDTDDEESRQAVRNLIKSQDLFVIGNDNGIRLVSPIATETEPTTSLRPAEMVTEPEAVFDDEEMATVSEILSKLANDHLERGIKLKGLWIEQPDREEFIRSTVAKLVSQKVIERFTPRLQRAAHSRRNTDPFVRFTSGDPWRRAKQDMSGMLKELEDLTQ